ncbi:MAG: ABC transporter permease subunit [Burkholderiaceae bacterium]
MSERPSIAARSLAEGSIALALIGWWLASRGMPDYILPGPAQVGSILLRLFTDSAFFGHTAASLTRVVASVLLAMLIAGLLALVARRFPILEWVVQRRIQPFLNAFPSLGWAILAVIWFNVSETSVIFVEVVILIPFCLINITAGLDEIDAEVVEMGRSFTRLSGRLVWRLYLPLLAPYLLAAARSSYGIGWKLALVAELFGAEHGLGFLMVRAQYTGQMGVVMATSLAIVLFFLVGEKLVIDPLARRFAPH